MSETNLNISDKGAVWMPRSFWTIVTKRSQKKYLTSDELWSACVEYFIWATENPLFITKTFNCAGEIVLKQIPKPRIFSIKALCLFIGVPTNSWYVLRHDEEYADIVTKILDVIYCQKFESAAVDIFNPSIVAKDLGLSDRHELSGPEGMPISSQTIVNINSGIKPKEASLLYHRMLKNEEDNI